MGTFSKVIIFCGAAAISAVAVLLADRYRRRLRWQAQVLQFVRGLDAKFDTPTTLLQKIAEDMRQEMVNGLKGSPGACLKMLPSFVDRLPDGSEEGVFYALDLGGTNFRAMRALLKGREGRVAKAESEAGIITNELMTGDGKDLFDMMASRLKAFVAKESEDFKPAPGRQRELGFTFSFPVNQTSIKSGTILTWTKGFSIPQLVGKDVVAVMEDALRRQNLDMKITALVNDTVGTLAGARYVDSDVQIAVILGTGTNACYEEVEESSFRLTSPLSSSKMVINTEWGNFRSINLPRTAYDEELCDKSPNPNEQHFEKLTSGMYLGEIVRLALVDLQQSVGIFSGGDVKIFQRLVLTTPSISRLHSDSSWSLSEVGKILKETFDVTTDYFQRKIVKDIVRIVSRRAARLAAAGTVGALKKIGRDNGGYRTVVAVDGGLYEKYTQFRETLEQTLLELLGVDAARDVKLVLSKDGSGLGAALLAASHSQYLNS